MSYSSRVLRACALLALPTSAFAQSTKGPTIFSPAAQVGTVNLRAAIVLQDYTVKPLPLLKVVARNADRADSVAAQTDLDGRTTLTLTVGVYTVRARTPQPVGGRMYEWAVKVVVRPQQSQSMDLTNSNASRSDSVATTPAVVAEAKPAPQPPSAAPQPTPVQPAPAQATAATQAQLTSAQPTSAQSTQPQTNQAKAAQPKTAQPKSAQPKSQPQSAPTQQAQSQAVTAQSTTPKTVASQPAPAPAAPTKVTAPVKAEAVASAPTKVETAAATPAKSTTQPKPAAPVNVAPAPSTAEKAVVAKSEPPKSAPTTAVASATQVAAAPSSVPSSAPASKHADAAPRPHRRTSTSGLMVGLAFDASSIRSDDLNSRTESGPGVAGMIGWGITKNFAIALDASGAQISSVDGNYNLGHADIGARWHFVNRTAFVPFVDVGYAGRALMKRDVTLTDNLGNTSTGTLTYMGTGLSYGGGLEYFITPGIAFGGAFKWTTGRFSQVRFENLTVEDLQLDASSARLNMGFTWYPMGR